MGTNYYRIPKTSDEIDGMFQKLNNAIARVEHNSLTGEYTLLMPWDIFTAELKVHLGKRSAGWKFCWNFHKEKYYSGKESLLEFIRSGRVVNEYGKECDIEEFITMAFAWGNSDGLVADKTYFDTTPNGTGVTRLTADYDKEIDGLRVSSSTEFS